MSQKVLALVDDLFFSSKITSTGQLCGVPIQLLTTREDLIKHANLDTVKLIIIDLNGKNTEPFQAISEIRSYPKLSQLKILAYFSHVQTDLHEKALHAGACWVLPRSVFSGHLAKILKETTP